MSDGPASPEVSLPRPQIEFVDPQEAQIDIKDYGYYINPDKDTGPNAVFINPFIKYLKGILVTDTFKDHRAERTPWVLKQTVLNRQILLSNRLGITRTNSVVLAVETILWLANKEGVETD